MNRPTPRLAAALASIVITFALVQGIAIHGAPQVQGEGAAGQLMAANAAPASSHSAQ